MNFLYRLKEYMRGRNGVDNLSIALVVVAMIISFILNLCGIRAGILEDLFLKKNGWQAESDAAILLSGLGIDTSLHNMIM